MTISENLQGSIFMTISMAAYISNDALMKISSSEFFLFQAIFLRGVLATIILFVITYSKKELLMKISPQDRKPFLLRITAEVGGTICILSAVVNMPIANATAILQCLPLAITFGAVIFLNEKVGWRRWVAIALGFLGVLIIIKPGSDGFNWFSISALLAVGFIVLRDLSTRRLSSNLSSIFIALLSSIAITIVSGALIFVTGWKPFVLDGLFSLSGAACFMVLGSLFGVMAMRVGEVSYVAPFRYTILLWAILIGIFMFEEYPDVHMLYGSTIIILTGFYSFQREYRSLR